MREKKKEKEKKPPDHAGLSRILIIDRERLRGGGGRIEAFFAQFKSQPVLISRALRHDKFTRRTCYHSRHPHAFILGGGGRERVRRDGMEDEQEDERKRETPDKSGRMMSMKGEDFSISHSSRRYKCKRTVRDTVDASSRTYPEEQDRPGETACERKRRSPPADRT